MRIISAFLLPLFFFLIILAVILSLSIGIGYILSLILPFSLFEGSLLSIIAVISGGALWYMITRSVFTPTSELTPEGVGFQEIPPDRFWQTPEERTWQNWLQYVLANSIYEIVEEVWAEPADMDELEAQELSIELAEAALGIIKRRAAQARTLRMTRAMLRRELAKEGHPFYDDELLDLAADAVNLPLMSMEEKLREIAREQRWDEKADVPQ
jgi:hypothetical protein